VVFTRQGSGSQNQLTDLVGALRARIAHAGLPLKDKRFAPIFIVDMGTPGVKLLARASYELVAAATRSSTCRWMESRSKPIRRAVKARDEMRRSRACA